MVSISETQEECFEYRQDVALIYGAFISALKRIKEDSDESDFSLKNLSDEQLDTVGEIVSTTLNLITQKLEDKVCRNAAQCKRSKVQQRIHAVVLFHVLKNHGICCKEASEYFDSVDGLLPSIDWKTYFHLQEICQWQLLFFEQMIDLQPSTVAAVSRQISHEIDSKNISSLCALDSVLLVLLDKLFVEIPVSCKTAKAAVNFSFQFRLSLNSGADSNNIDSLSSTSTIIKCEHVLMLLCSLEKQVLDLNLVKIILRGLKTLLDKVIKCVLLPQSLVSCDAVKVYLEFSKHFFSGENAKSLLHDAFKTFKYDSNSNVNNPNQEENVVMQVFSVLSKLDYLWSSSIPDIKCPTDKPPWLEDLSEHLQEIPQYLPSFPFSSSQENAIDVEEFIKLTTQLVENREKTHFYAYKLLVMSPEFLARQDVISCVEKHSLQCVPNNASVMVTMMESVLKMQGLKKNSMIEVFVAIYNQIDFGTRRSVLKQFVTQHGLSEFFKLPYFEGDFKSSNKNVTLEQSRNYVLSLCLQSPEKALQMIIDKQFAHGCISTILQAFKEVDFICSYKDSKDSLPLLIKILRPHFCSEILGRNEADNKLAIIRSLMKAFNETDEAFPLNVFLESCIFPYLQPDEVPGNCNFLLTVLDVVLTHSIESDQVKWVSKLVAPPVIVLLCQIISVTIIQHKGFLKAAAIGALNSFMQLYNKLLAPKKFCLSEECKKWIKMRLQHLHPLVLFYIKDLMGLSRSDVAPTDLQSVVFWYAVHGNKGDAYLLEEHLEADYSASCRTALVLAVASILPNLTANEMLQLIESLCCVELKYLQTSPEESEVPTNERKSLEVVSIFVDCLIMLSEVESFKGKLFDWAFIVSSFGQALKIICDNLFCTLTFHQIFMELCRLIGKTSVDSNNISIILQRILEKVKDEKDTYRSLSTVMYGLL